MIPSPVKGLEIDRGFLSPDFKYRTWFLSVKFLVCRGFLKTPNVLRDNSSGRDLASVLGILAGYSGAGKKPGPGGEGIWEMLRPQEHGGAIPSLPSPLPALVGTVLSVETRWKVQCFCLQPKVSQAAWWGVAVRLGSLRYIALPTSVFPPAKYV